MSHMMNHESDGVGLVIPTIKRSVTFLAAVRSITNVIKCTCA
jgi:hypothetical protein